MGYRRGKNGRDFFSMRHRHDESCEVVPVEDRATRFQGWSPVMFPRMTQEEATRQFAAGQYPVDPGPRLAILRMPVENRTLPYVTTWDEWNEEAEKPERGYDAELQRGTDGILYAHVRSKPGSWGTRRKARQDYMDLLGPAGRAQVRPYQKRSPGQLAREVRREQARRRESAAA
jgi:hypothetical protein